MTKNNHGFTVIELILTATLIGVASFFLFLQKQDIEIAARDNNRKTSINAMYYSLEEVFYVQNNYYPQYINSENITSMDPTLFSDPNGVKIGNADSEYSYTPTNCKDNQCKSYSLKATLENEADYIKNSRNN